MSFAGPGLRVSVGGIGLPTTGGCAGAIAAAVLVVCGVMVIADGAPVAVPVPVPVPCACACCVLTAAAGPLAVVCVLLVLAVAGRLAAFFFVLSVANSSTFSFRILASVVSSLDTGTEAIGRIIAYCSYCVCIVCCMCVYVCVCVCMCGVVCA